MLAVVQNKHDRFTCKSGFKMIKTTGDKVKIMDNEFIYENKNIELNSHDYKLISFEEENIMSETMASIVIDDCVILDGDFQLNGLTEKLKHVHMTRFSKKFNGSFGMDLSKFNTMDVINLQNVNNIVKDLDSFDSFEIFNDGKVKNMGKGMYVSNFDSNIKYLYLLVPNTWHRIEFNRDNRSNLIIHDEGKKDDLLFLKYSPESIKDYIKV